MFMAVAFLMAGMVTSYSQAQPPVQRLESPGRMLSLPRAGTPGSFTSPYQPRNPPPAIPGSPQFDPPAVRAVVRPFNLDSAVARILADQKLMSAVGEFELVITNGAKLDITLFPLLVHVFDGQVRTEMDISAASTNIYSAGPFAALRQVGLTRVINLTQVQSNVRVTSQVFPEGNCYLTSELPAEDMLMLIRLDKRLMGSEVLAGIPCEKTVVTLVYANGERREGRIWTASGALRQMQFDVGDSRLTVRIQDAQHVGELTPQEIAAQRSQLFELPKHYTKLNDMDAVLTRVFTIRQRAGR
ncbi:MAG: hypothetical protein EBS05_22640 [Proteobacteria bacterium]|nr:hypothetical protein [Pseudomonadota bacterium]